MNWKKRGRKGWTGRKTAKELSKSRERQYGEGEIKQQLQEDFEGDEFRYKGGKKKKNEIAKLEYWRDLWKQRALEQKIREEKGDRSWYLSSYKYEQWVDEYQEKIDNLKNNKKI